MSSDPEEDYEMVALTPYLDDSPAWWKALLLPPLVVGLAVLWTVLTIWDHLRELWR